MRTVKEMSKLTGVSVRTLHHYDAIGLLHPAKVTEAGYRLYDDAAVRRLQNILLFRELQFSLKEIKSILDDPNFDPQEALAQQIKLLELQRKYLDGLIAHAREIQNKGMKTMNFQAFDKTELENYKEEAKAKWGSTDAYKEYEQRAGKDVWQAGEGLMARFGELGQLRDLPCDAEKVQEKIGEIKDFITEHFYTCTKEILHGLGQMYVADERMKRNIDKVGGDGTAEFAKQAIEVYCKE